MGYIPLSYTILVSKQVDTYLINEGEVYNEIDNQSDKRK